MFPRVERTKPSKWEKRRKFEEERRKRILDPKLRQMGVDVQGLKQQVESRRRREEETRRRDEELDLTMVTSDLTALSLEKQRHEDMRILNQKMADFWRYQELEQKSKYSVFGSENQYTIDAGPSSAKSFTGEDLEMKHRLELQKQQQKYWLQSQLAERRAMSEKELNISQKNQEWETQLRNKATLLHQAEERAKRQLEKAIAHFNKEKAVEDCVKMNQMKSLQQMWNLEEQVATENSDLLTESTPSEAQVHIHGPRSKSIDTFYARPKTAALGNLQLQVRPVDRFKGFPPEQVMQFRLWQRQQIQKKQEQERRKKMDELSWAQEEKQRIERRMQALDEAAKRKQEYLKSVAEENMKLAQQHHEAQRRVNHDFTKHVASDEFYTKFQTSSR